MVSVTVNLDEKVLQKLAERAASEGTTVPDLIAQIVSSDEDGAIALTAEQEQAVIDADAEVERGEWVSAEEALTQLRARAR